MLPALPSSCSVLFLVTASSQFSLGESAVEMISMSSPR